MGKHKKVITMAAVSMAVVALIFRIPRVRKSVVGA